MGTFYRNRETGLVQAHPVSGIGHDLNAVEIGEDGKPTKPYTSLAPSAEELRAAKALMKDHSASPLDVAASEAVIEQAEKKKATSKTTDKSVGESNQEGGS